MNNIKVSVIVLTYNHEKYIRQALDSILMQKVDFQYEILIGDDASTDKTADILQEYKNKYPDIIKLYLNKINLGATRNAYNLLMSAQGEYLATCEGDDYWIDENKLKIQIDFLDNNKEFIGCTHYCKIVDENDSLISLRKMGWIKYKDIFRIEDFDGIHLPGQLSTFVRRNIFLKNKNCYKYFYDINRDISDRTSILLYLFYGHIKLIKLYMSSYRKVRNMSSDNITSKVFLKNNNRVQLEYDMLIKTEKAFFSIFRKHISFKNRRKELFADAVIQFLIGNNGNLNTAKVIFRDYDFKMDIIFSLPFIIIRKVASKVIYE